MDEEFWKWAGKVDTTLKYLKESVLKLETNFDNHLKHHQALEMKTSDRMFKAIFYIVSAAILIFQIIIFKGL